MPASSSPPRANASVSSSTRSTTEPGGRALQASNDPLHATHLGVGECRRWVAGMLSCCLGGVWTFVRPGSITRFGRQKHAVTLAFDAPRLVLLTR